MGNNSNEELEDTHSEQLVWEKPKADGNWFSAEENGQTSVDIRSSHDLSHVTIDGRKLVVEGTAKIATSDELFTNAQKIRAEH